jgi:hypothetical protein
MSSSADDLKVCPYSYPALCRICARDCNARELAELIQKLEDATQRVRLALEEARQRIIAMSDDALQGEIGQA